MHISIKDVRKLLDESCLLIFKDAIDDLDRLKDLTKEDKIILDAISEKLNGDNLLVTDSHFIYLSNSILKIEWVGNWNYYDLFLRNGLRGLIKRQLFLELAILCLQKKILKKVSLHNNNLKLYSLRLNQKIYCKFDLIERVKEDYIFYHNKKKVLTLKENKRLKITKKVSFLESDRNPLHNKNDHPEVDFVWYSLGIKTQKEWISQLKNAYNLIQENCPKIYNEIEPFLDSIVPIGYVPYRQISSTYSSCFGIIYLSYTDTDIIQADALIHEISHTIFNIIKSNYELIEEDSEFKYYSVYRPDARTLIGCLMGLHAFVAVQNFYRGIGNKIKDKESIGRFIGAYMKNRKMIEIIEEYAKFKEKGKFLFEDIKVKFHNDDVYFNVISKKYPELFEGSSKRIDEHFATAQKENDVLLY